MTHKKKIKMARSMRSKDEEKRNISIFQSTAWEERKRLIKEAINARLKVRKKENENNNGKKG